MNDLRGPFNTSGVAQAAALAALDDLEHVRGSVESNRAGLAQLAAGFQALNIHYVPSFANFVLVELHHDAEPTSEDLLGRGIFVRPMRWMGLPTTIRVTVGTREENDKFLAALESASKAAPHAPTPQSAKRFEENSGKSV